jgi:hypothetical protein
MKPRNLGQQTMLLEPQQHIQVSKQKGQVNK